jgi:CheY-like chemotaxis protein
MPRMSGLEVAKAIADFGWTTKIILLSSHIDKSVAAAPNIAAFTAKPIRRASLVHMICSVLSPAGAGAVRVPSPPRALRVGTSPNRPRVLLAEDNETNRTVITQLLMQGSCDVVEATNGAEAVELLTDDIDLVLLDVHMPVMDGLQAAYGGPPFPTLAPRLTCILQEADPGAESAAAGGLPHRRHHPPDANQVQRGRRPPCPAQARAPQPPVRGAIVHTAAPGPGRHHPQGGGPT